MKRPNTYLAFVILFSIFFSACTPHPQTPDTISGSIATSEVNPSPSPTMYLGQQTDPVAQKEKLCGSIDKSDIIIELSFAEGITLDSSYETGFYYTPIYSNMKLARRDCDYRVGFSFEEMKGKGAVELGVRGYTDNVRRQVEANPISITFDSEGKPNSSLPLKIKILN